MPPPRRLPPRRSADYCECGFQQFSEVFKDADLSQNLKPTDPRLEILREKTLAACASKVDEAQVKANFLQGCVEGNQKKSAYCTCAWQGLRESLEVAELLGDGTQPRFIAAKTNLVRRSPSPSEPALHPTCTRVAQPLPGGAGVVFGARS